MTDELDTQDEQSAANVPDDHAARDAQTGELLPYYCPGCGRGYQYPALCSGTPVAPHKETQTVSTDELSNDPDDHTAAPASE